MHILICRLHTPLQEKVSEPVTIKIVHTNDIHGRSAYQEDSVVGFEKLGALIAQEQPALVLDAAAEKATLHFADEISRFL